MKKLLVLISLLLATNAWGGSLYLECNRTLYDAYNQPYTRTVTLIIDVSEKTFTSSDGYDFDLPLEVSKMFYSAEHDGMAWSVNRIDLALEVQITSKEAWSTNMKTSSYWYQCEKSDKI